MRRHVGSSSSSRSSRSSRSTKSLLKTKSTSSYRRKGSSGYRRNDKTNDSINEESTVIKSIACSSDSESVSSEESEESSHKNSNKKILRSRRKEVSNYSEEGLSPSLYKLLSERFCVMMRCGETSGTSKFHCHKRCLGESKTENRRRRRALKKMKQQSDDDMSDHSEATCKNIPETLSHRNSLKKSSSREHRRRYERQNHSFPSNDYNMKYHLYDESREDEQSRLRSSKKISRRQRNENYEDFTSSSKVVSRTMRELTNQGVSYNNTLYNPPHERLGHTNQQNPGIYSATYVDAGNYQHNANTAHMQDLYAQHEAAHIQAPYPQQEGQHNQYYSTNPCYACNDACVPPLQLAVDGSQFMIQNFPTVPLSAYNPSSAREQVVDSHPYNENTYYDPRYHGAQQYEQNTQYNNDTSTSAPLGNKYEGIHVQNENCNTIDPLMYY